MFYNARWLDQPASVKEHEPEVTCIASLTCKGVVGWYIARSIPYFAPSGIARLNGVLPIRIRDKGSASQVVA